MAPRHKKPTGVFDNIGHYLLIPVLTAALAFIGWYYLTDYKVSEIQKTSIELSKKADKDKEQERLEREKLRDKFLEVFNKQSDTLAKLDTRLAVGEAEQKIVARSLQTISEQLTRLNESKK